MASGQDISMTERMTTILERLFCRVGNRCSYEKEKMERIADIFKESEKDVLDIINSYIHNEEDPSCKKLAHDTRGYSVLHLAAERDFLSVAEKLLESEFDPLTPACPEGKTLALHVAIEKHHDDMAALIIRYISNTDVRELFVSCAAENSPFKVCKMGGSSVDILNLNHLIENHLVKTILAVFDSLKEVNENGLATVHVKLLEEDEGGLEPTHKSFNDRYHTVFHNLVKTDKKVTTHPVIRVLIDHKWNRWGRYRFISNFLLYLVGLFSLTFSVVVAVKATDVRKYDTALQKSRAFFEIFLCLLSLYRLLPEVRQIIRHKLIYWKQVYNWIELFSAGVIFVVVILRFTTDHAHWFILAIVYMAWVLRIFKYAAVSSQTGAYAESLRQILIRNILPFSLLFIVVNFAFGGVFLLVLKGEGTLQIHDETDSILEIYYVGLRTIIEAQPIVEYTGPDGYRPVGTIVMLIFLTMTIVVLLNILIAQLSDTYASIKSDALRSVQANRVAILARYERNEWIIPRCMRMKWGKRKKFYKALFENIDLKKRHQSFSTPTEDIEDKLNKLIDLQIKTDLKVQTLKSRLRRLDSKFTQEFT